MLYLHYINIKYSHRVDLNWIYNEISEYSGIRLPLEVTRITYEYYLIIFHYNIYNILIKKFFSIQDIYFFFFT